MHKIFVYGTLKSTIPELYHVSSILNNLPKKESYTYGSIYLIPGHRFCFPALVLDSNAKVYGEVYEIDDSILNELDLIEGINLPCPLYHRERIVVNDTDTVWTYAWNNNRELDDNLKIKHGNFEILHLTSTSNDESYLGYPLDNFNQKIQCYIQELNQIFDINI